MSAVERYERDDVIAPNVRGAARTFLVAQQLMRIIYYSLMDPITDRINPSQTPKFETKSHLD